jgi:hypothetical protein
MEVSLLKITVLINLFVSGFPISSLLILVIVFPCSKTVVTSIRVNCESGESRD